MAWAETYRPLSFVLLRTEGATYFGKTDRFQIRGHSIPKDPKTTDQLNSRSFLGVAKREWMTLSAEEKAQWKEFAQENLVVNKKEHFVKWRGIDAFCRSSITLQMAGRSARPGLPAGRPPEMPVAIELLPGHDRRELAFKLWHEVGNLDDHALLIRLTPTGKSAACRPYKTGLRHVRGVGPESVIQMPMPGEVVRVPNVRVDLEPGYLYAVEIRVMRLSDGATSDPLYQIAEREEAAPVEAMMSVSDTTDQAAISEGDGDEDGTTVIPLRRTVPKLTPAEKRALQSAMPKFRGSKWFPSARVDTPGWTGRQVE